MTVHDDESTAESVASLISDEMGGGGVVIQVIGPDQDVDSAPAIPELHGDNGLDTDALTAAHLAVEDRLVILRDARISVFGPRNGFVIREYTGEHSSILRMGTAGEHPADRPPLFQPLVGPLTPRPQRTAADVVDGIIAHGWHPCTEPGCEHTVTYDDEPFCFKHSPDSGSSVSGYSYKATHP